MKKSFLVYVFLLIVCTAHAQLEAGFRNPPDEAKARVFWWWLEGNINKTGILTDLVAMKNAGIKGAILFDAGSSSYNGMEKTSAGPVFMSKEWIGLFDYTCHIADSLGLEISLNIGSGWNDGGPWVTPELASKKLVWSELNVQGPYKLHETLPMPEKLFVPENSSDAYYKPIAVLAIKLNGGNVKPLENFDIKAVHSIYNIPFTKNGLGYDWNIFMRKDTLPAGEAHARLEDVIDISAHVGASGRINWDVPAGNYLILRFGYTATGIKVSTHSPGGGGLAMDYMSMAAMDVQYKNVVTALTKGHPPKSLKYLHDDSWELGASNWTADFTKEFKSANGYDIVQYLPILTGRILGNRATSNNFLYDFRRTIADLIYKNHYQRFRDLAQKEGLGIHSESGGPHPAPIDALKNLGLNAIPMGEFWIRANTHRVEPHRRLYVKQSASAAHIYGKQFVQAEGPTSIGPHWEEDFAYMKPTLDRVYCEGMNRLVLHTFTHSPQEAGIPGNEYFAGTHFNPNVTWWKQAPAFLQWNARNCFMLSRGRFVADVCYYYGDNVPNQVPLKHIDPELGEGYDYDVCNSEVILQRMSVKNGKIVLPDGMQYAVLVLPPWKDVNQTVLAKIMQLVKDGATVIGPRPEGYAGLQQRSSDLVKAIAAAVWGDIDGKQIKENTFGKGKVIYGKTIREVLQDKGIARDVQCASRKPDALIDYIHRTTEEAEIYYIVNRNERPEYLQATFRIKDKVPELWNPDNGAIIPQSIYDTKDGRIQMPLFLAPFGSVFVVFRKASGKHHTSIALDGKGLFPELPADTFDVAPFVQEAEGKISYVAPGRFTLDGRSIESKLVSIAVNTPWLLHFDTAWGGPANTTFDQLISWTEHPDPGIKYYSGTATYSNTFNIPPIKDQRVYLDLGELYNVAEVTVNGKNTGVWWTHPFRNDITAFIQPGTNRLEVKVVNLWPNRIIGDQMLPEAERFTRTNVRKFNKDYPLRKSGLIGPVSVSLYDIR